MHDEWVLLLSGSAGLRVEGEGERGLRPGDHVLIAAHRGVHGKGRAVHFPSLQFRYRSNRRHGARFEGR